MGEKVIYQPLTTGDKVSVILYRAGIVIFTLDLLVLAMAATFSWKGLSWHSVQTHTNLTILNSLLYLLYLSVGVSVFTIHLYVKRFRRFIKSLYALSVISLALMLFLNGTDIASLLLQRPAASILWLPLSGCIAFITMKEAFCFRLLEGYILTMLLPLFVLLLSTRVVKPHHTGIFLLIIALMLVLFTFRKVFMPVAYDIGDKSAYEV